MNAVWIRGVVAACSIVAACAQEPAAVSPAGGTAPTDAKDQRPSDFARFVSEGDGGHFDTAITTYRNDDGVELKLFAAVHIADGACYALLEQRFTECDALLYELVGPSDYRPKKGDERGSSFVSMLQQGMKNGLELEFQLDGIDYSAANFVHADMTGKEFAESMEERGETLFGMLWQLGMNAQAQMMAQAQAKDGEGGDDEKPKAGPSEFDLVRAFRSGEGRHTMRLLMASQLEGMEAAAAGGKGSTLLEGRNEKCLEVLQQQIAAGKRKLGIYYGGAHLTHMEQRLCDDLGFHKKDHEWIVAWDCKKRPDPKVDRELFRNRRNARHDAEMMQMAAARWRTDHAGATPKLQDLRQLVDGEPYWGGNLQDPWGRDYAITGYERTPFVDVRSCGEDGIADTADDIHSASARDLRRMRRATEPGEPEQPVKLGGRVGGMTNEGFLEGAKRVPLAAKITKASADVQAIHNAAKLFRVMHGTRPTMTDLTTPDANGRTYIEDSPKDPWGHDYEIRDTHGKYFEVVSPGPDGVLDTDDDLVAPARQGR